MKKILIFLILMFGIFQQVSADSQGNIQYHLKLVENVLREVDISDLTEKQQKNRLEKLDILSDYAADGNFPNNDINSELTSIFRGSNGNLCAVGYLIYSDPEYRDYVDDIVKSDNLIRVMTIQNDPIFQQWSEDNGFSQIELAMIQPQYPTDKRFKAGSVLFTSFVCLFYLFFLYFYRKKINSFLAYFGVFFSCLFIWIVSLYHLLFNIFGYYSSGRGELFLTAGLNLNDHHNWSYPVYHYFGDNISYDILVYLLIGLLISLPITSLFLLFIISKNKDSHFIKILLGTNIVVFVICNIFYLYEYSQPL